jgi:uncharacterized membrane protein (DUF485 family)
VTTDELSRTIQLILAPVVMVSAASIFVSGLLAHYQAINDRVRALVRERFDLLANASLGRLTPERLAEIDAQLPLLLRRHRLVRDALLAVYASILALVISMCVIALTATAWAGWIATLVFGIFVIGVLALLLGVVLTVLEVRSSDGALRFEVAQVRRLRRADHDEPTPNGAGDSG